MAKQTLLAMTQQILSALSSDEVNSISDSTESLQVANIIQRKYYDIVSRGGLPDDDELFQLTASTDPTQPVVMTIPNTVAKMRWLKYFDSNSLDGTSDTTTHDVNTDIVQQPSWVTTANNGVNIGLGTKGFTVASSSLPVVLGESVTIESGVNTMIGTVLGYFGTTLTVNVTTTIGSGTFSNWIIFSNGGSGGPPGYKYVTILPLEQFIQMVNLFNPTNPEVRSYNFTDNGQSFIFYYKTNHTPQYCTCLSNFYILFDSYDSTVDNTLQSSKTLAFGRTVPLFSLTDGFVPDMDDNQFPLLVNESLALAFYELKQQPHAKAEQEIKRQWSTVQKNKSMTDRPTYFNELADFGRQPNTGGYSGRPRPNLRG